MEAIHLDSQTTMLSLESGAGVSPTDKETKTIIHCAEGKEKKKKKKSFCLVPGHVGIVGNEELRQSCLGIPTSLIHTLCKDRQAHLNMKGVSNTLWLNKESLQPPITNILTSPFVICWLTVAQ